MLENKAITSIPHIINRLAESTTNFISSKDFLEHNDVECLNVKPQSEFARHFADSICSDSSMFVKILKAIGTILLIIVLHVIPMTFQPIVYYTTGSHFWTWILTIIFILYFPIMEALSKLWKTEWIGSWQMMALVGGFLTYLTFLSQSLDRVLSIYVSLTMIYIIWISIYVPYKTCSGEQK